MMDFIYEMSATPAPRQIPRIIMALRRIGYVGPDLAVFGADQMEQFN